MADQRSVFQPVTPQDLSGPFSGFLTPPQPTPVEKQAQQMPGPANLGGGLAMVATAFLQGASQGRIKKYEQEQNERFGKLQTLNSYMIQIANDPDLTPEAKQLASQRYYQAIGGDLQEATKDSGKNKDGDNSHPGHHFGSIMKDLAQGLTGGKKPKGMPDPSNAIAEIHSQLYGADGKVKPEYSNQNALSGVNTQIQERLKALPENATQEQAAKATADLFPALSRYAGNEAKQIYGNYLSGYKPELSPKEKFEARGFELMSQGLHPPGTPGAKAAPGPPASATPVAGDTPVQASPGPPKLTPYDEASLAYATKTYYPREVRPENLKDVRVVLKDGSEVPAVEDPQAADPAKRWLDPRTNQYLDPTKVASINPRATPAESAAREDREVAEGAYREKHGISKEAKLTDTQRMQARVELTKAQSDARQQTIGADAQSLLASTFLLTGQMPAMGMGGGAIRASVIEGAAKTAKSLGMKPADVVDNWIGIAANKSSLNKLQGFTDFVESYSGFVNKQLDRLVTKAKEIKLLGSPLANQPVNWLRQHVGADKNIPAYLQLVNAAQTEVAKVLNNPASQGNVPEGARAEMKEFLNGNLTLDQIKKLTDTLKIEVANKKSAMEDQIKVIKDRVRNGLPEAPTDNGKPDDPMGIGDLLKKK